MFASISEIRRSAIAAESEGRFVAAIILLEQCLRIDPLDGYGWLVLSDAQKSIGDYVACRKSLNLALQYAADSEQWIVQTRLGMLASQLGFFKEAEQWYEAANVAEEAKRQRWLLVLRGDNLINLERYAEAENVLQEAIAMEGKGDELDEAYHTLGIALLRQGDFDGARQSLERAAEISPESTQTRIALQSLEGVPEAIRLAGQLQLRQ
jgi:tetratricopeptide (TPR) repeat protein